MSKGIIYVMTTVVPGLIKIGKTGENNFDTLMYNLEKNGYSNVAGLKRRFAIEVEDYDKKEQLLLEMFSKSRVPNTELFALDIDLVIQLLSSFDGKQVFPIEKSKEEVFDEAVKEREVKADSGFIPDGEYFLDRKVIGFGNVKGRAIVEDGVITVLRGSVCAPTTSVGFVPDIRKDAWIENDILQEDIISTSPSSAGWIIIGKSNNGWTEWKNKSGQPINIYRNNQ